MSQQTPHKRRVRYKGKNPRRFEERYKEHDPEKYPEQVRHVIAKGNTPAGSHIPICVEEILQVLDPRPGDVVLDATLGYGGHSEKLLERLRPGGKLFALDVDPLELPRTESRLRAKGYGEDVLSVRQMSFAGIRGLLHEAQGFDAILADLGVSSMQIDNPARGFTFKADGPLDLRLNPKRGMSAAELLVRTPVEKLARLLAELADEPHAELIARSIKSGRNVPETTSKLATAVRDALSGLRPKPQDSAVRKSLQRTFMALRIAVNEELTVLERFLQVLPQCLKPGGRVAILSFHSGEDRRVKRAFAEGVELGIYSKVSSGPILAGPQERRANPRSSCAKLRWAVRSELGTEHDSPSLV